MRLDIRYRLSFVYDAPVWDSQNEIRVRPSDRPGQRVISHRLTTAPAARLLTFTDYWGTVVDHVGVREPHSTFEVVAEASVETAAVAQTGRAVPIEAVADSSFVLDHVEYLTESIHTAGTRAVADRAASASAHSTTVCDRVDVIVDTVHEMLVYEGSATDIGVSIADLVAGGKGVCQDYAHLTIAMLRGVGIPARYVSGYLFASDERTVDDGDPDQVSVQTHAWVEAAVPGHGWYPVDPTNRQVVTDRHVVIGHGRDYDDVAPVRGVFAGTATPSVEAEVVIARMGPAARSVITDAPRRIDDGQFEARERLQQQQQQQ